MSACMGGSMPQNCPGPCGQQCTIIHDGKRAQLCPVCSGSGVVPRYDRSGYTTTAVLSATKTCHGCGGKGWVTT